MANNTTATGLGESLGKDDFLVVVRVVMTVIRNLLACDMINIRHKDHQLAELP